MACLDIFAPGSALNVQFLMEQIWISTKGKGLVATEIYDFVLQNSSDQQVMEFCVSSPHLCGRKKKDGWEKCAELSRVRAGGWGWFYSREDLQGDQLTMTVPNSLGPPAGDTISFTGLDVSNARACPSSPNFPKRCDVIMLLVRIYYI
jgi:hypothetical protein